MLEIIKSRKNEEIKLAAKLVDSASFRREKGMFVVEGARLCRDAALSNIEIVSAYFTGTAQTKYNDYITQIIQECRSYRLIEEHVADALSATKHNQGVFCVCRIPEQHHSMMDMKALGTYIALEQIQDPANLGSVLRTAEALGVSGVLFLGDCCDIYSPKALRASMGAIFRLPFYIEKDTSFAIDELKRKTFAVLAAVPSEQAQNVLETNFSKPTVMLIGNEGNGLSQTAIDACDACVTIPMMGRAESLNAASSAAILMWEMMRGRIDMQLEESV